MSKNSFSDEFSKARERIEVIKEETNDKIKGIKIDLEDKGLELVESVCKRHIEKLYQWRDLKETDWVGVMKVVASYGRKHIFMGIHDPGDKSPIIFGEPIISICLGDNREYRGCFGLVNHVKIDLPWPKKYKVEVYDTIISEEAIEEKLIEFFDIMPKKLSS